MARGSGEEKTLYIQLVLSGPLSCGYTVSGNQRQLQLYWTTRSQRVIIQRVDNCHVSVDLKFSFDFWPNVGRRLHANNNNYKCLKLKLKHAPDIHK